MIRRLALTLYVLTAATLARVGEAQHTGFVLDSFGLPKTIQELSDMASLIVDVRVVSVFPARIVPAQPKPRPPYPPNLAPGPSQFPDDSETDVLVKVDKVLKGSFTGPLILVTQPGGMLPGRSHLSSQFFLMNTGQRYLLFLVNPDQEELNRRPVLSEVPRYSFCDAIAGLVLIDEGRTRVRPGMLSGFRERYEGKNSSEMITEIETYQRARSPLTR